MKVKFAHVAELAFTSQSGNLNVIGIFNQIGLPSLPATFAKFMIAVGIRLEPSDVGRKSVLSITVRDPDNLQRHRMEANIGMDSYPALNPILHFVAPYEAFVFEKYGLHLLQVGLNDKVVDTIEIMVMKPEAQ